MSSLIIEGGNSLNGQINVPGGEMPPHHFSRFTFNKDEVVISNVPQISDVDKMIKLLEQVGAKCERVGSEVKISAAEVNLANLDRKLVKGMRSSVLMFGPLLARLGEVSLPEPGGCIIGNRPLGAHLDSLRKLGATVEIQGESYCLKAKKLNGTRIILPEFSVTATENILMAAVLAEGTTTIELAAAEPHVQDLCNFGKNGSAD